MKQLSPHTDSSNSFSIPGKLTLSKRIIEEINQLDLSVKAHIQDIRSCPGENDIERTSHSIRSMLRKSKDLIENLENLSLETKSKDEKMEMLDMAAEFKMNLERNRQSFRDAIVSSQIKSFSDNRTELLQNHGDKTDSIRKRKQNEVIHQTHAVSDSLTSVSRLLSEQIEKSADALTVLGSSSHTIRDVKEEMALQGSEMTTGKLLITKFKRRAFTDQILVGLAYVFFFLCALYVLFKRLYK